MNFDDLLLIWENYLINIIIFFIKECDLIQLKFLIDFLNDFFNFLLKKNYLNKLINPLNELGFFEILKDINIYFPNIKLNLLIIIEEFLNNFFNLY